MYVYNRKFIIKIRNYLNEDYSHAIFSTKIKDTLVKYQYKFSVKKIVPYQKVKSPYYILMLKIKFISLEEVDEQFRLYPYKYYSLGSKLIRRRYFKDILNDSIIKEIKNMFGEELTIKTSFSNEKIFDLFKK